MKKLLLSIALIGVTAASFAQTPMVTRQTLPDLDTSVTTTTITARTVYDTATTIVILKYKAPVVVPIVPGKLITKSTTNKQVYYSNVSNLYIHDITIDLLNGSQGALYLNNCKIVHIKHCIIKNTTNDGIQLVNCSNVLIDSCLITNVKAGVNAKYSTTVQVIGNQFLNMNGPFPSGNFVQFNNVNGAANRINGNRCEDIAGVAKKPEDGISVYQSNGLPGDSIQVIGNYIRGGQIYNTSGGGAGIVLGDVGGSYQVARYNTVVNGGFVGMQVQGGTHIKMDHNTIYGAVTPYSNCGLCYGNYSGQTSSDITISYNKVKYFKTNGSEMDAWYDSKAGYVPIGWYTNILKAGIDASILPVTLITYQ